jgi:hypothetical protein
MVPFSTRSLLGDYEATFHLSLDIANRRDDPRCDCVCGQLKAVNDDDYDNGKYRVSNLTGS